MLDTAAVLQAKKPLVSARDSETYLRMATKYMNRGNLKQAKWYLEQCFRYNKDVKKAKKLYSQIAQLQRMPKPKIKPVNKISMPQNLFLKRLKSEPEKEFKDSIPAVREKASRSGTKATILWEDFEGTWGPYGDNPPAGWTIIDNGTESPPVWNQNDWYNYDNGGTQGHVARVYYSPIENQDEWLITPTLNIPAETCSLKFWNYFNQYSTTDTGYVLGSTDNGSTWSDTIAVYTSDILGVDTAYDITSWASGQSQVKIAFNYKANDDLYWMVDACSVATYITYQYDIGITAFLSPPDSVAQGRRMWTPKAVIHNFGTDRVRNFNVFCNIGSNNPFSDSYNYSAWFNSGTTDTITFTNWDSQIVGYDTMTVYHDLSTDMDRSNDTLKNQIKIVRSYFTGGPDTYGYSWIDSDTTGGPAYSWINATGSTPVTLGDDANVKVALPFPFRFYENTYDSIYIVSNGYVSFDYNTSYSNGTIPSTGTPNNSIYVFWDDLDPSAGGSVWYKAIGGNPSSFVVTWDDVPHRGETNGGSFQVILYENGDFIIQYKDVKLGNSSYNFGRSATVGIENSDGSTGLQYENNGTPFGNLLLAQRAIDFPCNDVPTPPIIYPLYSDLDGNFPVYWSPSIDRDGISAYQLDEVAPDTLLYDQANANGVFNLTRFTRANTRSHSPSFSYGSENVSNAEDTMISVNSYLGAQSVEFWWWGGCESGIDRGYFDISTDNGTSWINMDLYTGNDSLWCYENVDVSSYSAYNINLRFRYHSDGSINYGGFWVDDILVNSWQWVQTLSNSIVDTTYNVTGASNGWHYYRARGKDNLDNWGGWGNIEDIWVGVNNPPSITIQTPSNDTIITTPLQFTIKWTDNDPDNNANISLYYDNDNTGYDGTLITSGISEDDPADSFVWDLTGINGRYYVYGKIDDGINAPVYSYSVGTVTTGDLIKVATDWIAMYISNDANNDPGTYTAATEPGHPYGDNITLLYGGGAHNPWSSYNTIRSYQTSTDYVTRASGAVTETGYTVAQLANYYTSAAFLDSKTLIQEWTVNNGEDNFIVKQIIAARDVNANSKLQVSLRLINHANNSRTFSFRYEWDIHVDTTDAPWVRRYYSTTPNSWEPREIHWWNNLNTLGSLEEARDEGSVSAVTHYLSVTEPISYSPAPTTPDSLYYVKWASSYGGYENAFQVPYMGDGVADSLPGETDAAVCYMWVDRTIPKNDSITITQYLLVTNPALAISLTEFTASYIPKENNIRVFWRTESEEGNLGFNIYRAVSNNNYVKLNQDIIKGAGNSSSPKEYSLTDTDIKKVGVYYYKLEQVNLDGTGRTYGPASVDIKSYIPLVSFLKSVFPNPFTTHSTSISFVVGLQDAEKKVTLDIYDVSGRFVKTLVNSKLESGYYTQRWGATDDKGKKVSSGVYYAVLKTGETTKVKKMVLFK